MGYASPEVMLEEMTLEQFHKWRAYAMIEPFLGDRLDQIGALIAKTLWDINRDPKKYPRPFELKDFYIVRKAFMDGETNTNANLGAAPTRKQSTEERVHALRLWAAAMAPTPKQAQQAKEQAQQRVQSEEAIAAAKAAIQAKRLAQAPPLPQPGTNP